MITEHTENTQRNSRCIYAGWNKICLDKSRKMAGTSDVWLVCFKQIKTKDAKTPLASFCEKRSARWNKPTWKSESISHLGISDDQSALYPSLLLWLLRTNEFCLDQFLNFHYDPHLLAHQFSCSPVNWQLLSSFRGEKRESIVIMGCNYSCVAGTELLLLTAVILSAFELLYDPTARNYSPRLEKTSHLSSSHNVLQSLSNKCQTGWLWNRKQYTKQY